MEAQLSSVMLNQQASAYENSLLSRLNTLVSVIVDDEEHYYHSSTESSTTPTAPLTELDLQDRLHEVKESLQEVIGYAHSIPNAFMGTEDKIFVLLLPILQTYGLMPPTPLPELPVEIEGLNVHNESDRVFAAANEDKVMKVLLQQESQSSEEGLEITGMCCSIFCLLLEQSLSTLHALTPSMSIPSTPISIPTNNPSHLSVTGHSQSHSNGTATPISTNGHNGYGGASVLVQDNLIPPFPSSSALSLHSHNGLLSPDSISHSHSGGTVPLQQQPVNPYLLPLQEHYRLLAQLGEMGWCETLVSLLFTHLEDETVCELLLYAMQLLLKLGPEENRVRMMISCDGCQAIIQAFTLHCENIPMTLIAFDVITLLAETSIEFRSKLGECGVCEAIVEALRLALAPFQSLLSREDSTIQSLPLPLPSPAASSVSSLGRVSVAGTGGGSGGVHSARTNSPATLPPHTERDGSNAEGSYQPPSELLSAQTVNVKNRTSPSSAEKKHSAHIDRQTETETEKGNQLVEHLTVLQDVEMIREEIENKHDLQEIALFCAKTCWLMGRLCENCFENKTLFGECDGCDVLVQVLRLFTEVSIKEDQQIRESSMNAELSHPPPLAFPTTTHPTHLMPDSSSSTTAFSVVLTWCCYAIGEMSESHDANQAIFGQTQALLTQEQTHMQTPHSSSVCLQTLLTLLSFYGESDRNLCILLCQCIRQLLECSESNKLQVALNSDVRVVELCIALIHHYMTSGKEVMPWLMNLLATLVSTDVANLGGTVGDGQKLELTLGRMILDCDGALVLIQVLLNYYDIESERDLRKRGDAGENTGSGSGSGSGVGMICLRVLQALTMLLSVIEHDGNEVVLEEILRSGCVAVIKEIVRRYHEEEEEIVEFAEMILTRLADLETLLLPNHQYHISG